MANRRYPDGDQAWRSSTETAWGPARSKNGTGCLGSAPVAEKLEGRPVEGVGRSGLPPDLVDLRRSQGFVLRLAVAEIAVETLHEASGGDVGDAPQRGEDRARAGELEGACQADQALASHLLAEP